MKSVRKRKTAVDKERNETVRSVKWIKPILKPASPSPTGEEYDSELINWIYSPQYTEMKEKGSTIAPSARFNGTCFFVNSDFCLDSFLFYVFNSHQINKSNY